MLFGNYSYSLSTLSSKTGHILKNKLKNKCVCVHKIIRLIIMKIKMKIKNRSRRYGINRPRYRHGHKFIISSIHEKVKQH